MADLQVDVRVIDIPRLISVYHDRAILNWWAKSWFNNREAAEASVEISVRTAVAFLNGLIAKDEMLEEFYPEQMKAYHQAIEMTREQLKEQLNV